MMSRAAMAVLAVVREPFHRPGWVYEEKVDGYRMLAYKDGPRVRLVKCGVFHETVMSARVSFLVVVADFGGRLALALHSETSLQGFRGLRGHRPGVSQARAGHLALYRSRSLSHFWSRHLISAR
jgi:hypothetical protein